MVKFYRFLLVILLVIAYGFPVRSQPSTLPAYGFQSAGRWVESEQHLVRLIRIYPVHPDRSAWLWSLAGLRLQQNRLKEAEPLLTELTTLADDPVKSRSQYWLARFHADYDNPEKALEFLTASLTGGAAFPERIHGELLQAWLQTRLGNWEVAGKLFSGFSDRYPESDYYSFSLAATADCFFQTGQYEEAVDLLQLILPVINEPGYLEKSRLLIAESYARLNNWKEAIIAFGQFEIAYPQNWQIDYIRYRLAWCLWMDNQKPQALRKVSEIGVKSWLYPYRRVLEVEVWKSSGQISQISLARLPLIRYLPDISRYNLSNRLWASMKLENWPAFERDLNLVTQEPALNLPVDSLFALLGQVYVESGNYERAAIAYQKAADLSVVLQRKGWPDLLFNAAYASWAHHDFFTADAYFMDFIHRFRGHRFEKDAFVYSLFCRMETNDPDSVESRILRFRDRYPDYYDDIDLIRAENLFQSGRETEGYDLLERKLRYSRSDSVRNRLLFRSSLITLKANRPDLALGSLRVLERFAPDYLPETVALLQIQASWQSGSVAFIPEQIRDYRTRFGMGGDNWLVPMETRVAALRGELTVHRLSSSLIRLTSWPSVAYVLETARSHWPADSLSSLLHTPQAGYLFRTFGEQMTAWMAFFAEIPIESAGDNQVWISRETAENWSILLNQIRTQYGVDAALWEQLGLTNDQSDLRFPVIFKLFMTGNWPVWTYASDNRLIFSSDLAAIRQVIDPPSLMGLDTTGLTLLFSEPFRHEAERFDFYKRLASAAKAREDWRLWEFWLTESMSWPAIANEKSAAMADLARYYFEAKEPDLFGSFYDQVRDQLPGPVARQLDLDWFKRRASAMKLPSVEKEGNTLLATWPRDQAVVDLVFLETVKAMVRDKKKRAATLYIKSFARDHPASEAVKEARKLVR